MLARFSNTTRDKILTLATFVIPFLVYLHTLAPTIHGIAPTDRPTIYSLDSAELVTGAYSLGIVHAPGYPLYLLIGKVFSYLPVRDVAYRLNLMSAFFAALTIAVLYRLVLKLTHHALISFATATSLAFSYSFWTASLVAEVYTLHAFFMVLVLYTSLNWAETREHKYLYRLALVYGLSFGNHTSTSLMALGLGYFLLATDHRQILKPRVLFGMMLAFASGWLVYLYLPLRYLVQPAFNYAGRYDANGVFHSVDLTTLRGLWWMVSGQQFRALMFSYRGPEILRELRNHGYWLWSNFLAVGIIPGTWGSLTLFTRRRRLGVSLLLIYAANLAFFATYRILDTESMYIPTYVIWTIWMGAGCHRLLEEISAWENKRGPGGTGDQTGGQMLRTHLDKKRELVYSIKSWSNVLQKIFLLIPLTALIVNYRYCDLSDNWGAKEQANAVLAQVEPNAIVVGQSITASTLNYMQIVEGRRLDVQVINRVFIGWRELRQLIKREIDQRPVYMIEKEAWLADEYRFVPLKTVGYELEKRTDNQRDYLKGD